MIKQITFENWKSFRNATLHIDPFTVLIGANASGKSNAVEALAFLSRRAQGKSVQEVIEGDSIRTALRGGREWIVLKGETQFSLSVVMQGEDEYHDYRYDITVETDPEISIVSDSLTYIEYHNNETKELWHMIANRKSLTSFLGDIWLLGDLSLLNLEKIGMIMMPTGNDPEQIKARLHKLQQVGDTLQGIFVLDPIPATMRGYAPLSDTLHSDASNLAGVLAKLLPERKAEVEATLLRYATRLPEGDIRRVWAEPVGRLATDAMLYCEEQWHPDDDPILIDARSMSDGTLRFLAIVTALLTRPPGSLLVIEDVDNGLHPSRSGLLVQMLREIGHERRVDLLVTTHNPALLDELEPDLLRFVTVAHRDPESGESKLTLLEDIANLPKLLASGSLGKLAARGALERSLAREQRGEA